DEHLAAHAEVREHGLVPRLELQPQVLAATADLGDRAAVQAGGEIGVPGDVAAHGARVRDRDLDDRALQHVLGEASPDDLDLRQLRHQVPAALEGAASFVSACQASSAAFCSASFLVRPTPEPRSRPATTAVAVNSLRWSGPSSAMRYSGTPRSVAAVSSWRLVFQSRPAPSSGALRSSEAKRWCTHSRAVSSPCSRYTAPISASVASARMLGLVPPPVRSSARPGSGRGRGPPG